MSAFRDILNLLTTSPGGLVYHLVLLFSIWAVVGLALSRWSRGERRGIVARLLVAGGVISCGRLVFFVVALVDRASTAQFASYLVLLGPPFERFLDALSVVLVCWAVAIPSQQRTLGRIFVGAASFLVVGLYLVSAMQWATSYQVDPGALYNASWQRWVWELGQAALLAGAIVYLFAVPVPERGTTMVMLGVLVAGHLLQATVPFVDDIPHFAAWVRFAQLLAFPLFAVIGFRLIAQRFDAQAATLQAVNQESLAQMTGLMDLLDTNRKMFGSLDLDAVLDNAIRSLSQTLQSDLCAVVLLQAAQDETAELVIRYQAPDTVRERKRFQLQDHPAIQHAVTRGKPVMLQPNENGHTMDVYRLLGSEESGPLLVQPIEYDDRSSGALLVCQPGQSTGFTPVQVRKCETMAAHIALALRNAHQHQEMRARIDQRTRDLGSLEQDSSRAKADLENRLRKAQDEIATYVQKLYETELAQQRAENDARELRQALNGQSQTAETVSRLEQQLAESSDQAALLGKKVATLETVRSQLEQQVHDLDEEKKQLRAHLSKAESSYTSLRTRARQMQAALSKGTPQQQVGLDAAAVDGLPYGTVICDAGGQILSVNPIAAERLGYQDESWKGQSVLGLWRDREWQDAVHAVTDRYTTQTALLEPFVVQRPEHKMEVALSALRVQERHVGAVLTFQDTHTSDEQTRARDEFLSSLAQDLRTPMTSILGYTELLMSESVGALEGMQRKFLQRVQANIERMGAMLNDLIGVTAIDAGKLEIELEPVDVTQVIDSALRKAQFRLEERELTTHVNMGSIPPIMADPEHLQQMIDNLLTNACTSSATGTTIRILAQSERDDTGQAHLHVAVSDTGGGVAPEDRGRVFERFYRADNVLVAGLGETGVGLAIVKALVEAHQGHVWIDTEVGEGTTFHFTLPYGLGTSGGSGSTEPLTAGDNGDG